MIGRCFEKLTVLEDFGSRKGHKYFLCVCECGKEKNVRGSHLRDGRIKSCGCSQIINLTDRTFGYLTVISLKETRNGNAYWNCNCVCGKITVVAAFNLKKGDVKSCGCKSKILFRKTSIENYGFENPSQSNIIKQKVAKANIIKYGTKCTLQVKETQDKTKKTLLKKYGTIHVMRVPEISLKAAKSQNNSYVLKHWKTDKEIICVASYEKKVVEYFNKNKINFKWQHKTFTMPDGRTFRPDCYLTGKRKPWVEIKGYFRDDAQEKWEWFHKERPNSELWDKEKLMEMKVL